MRIRTEHDAWEFLLNCWRDPAFGGDRPLTFEECALAIRLEPGDGRADWKAARAINLLQHYLNLTYLLAKRGSVSGRVSKLERELLAVGFRVAPGSTNIFVEIAKALTAIRQVLPAHWSTRAQNIVATGAMVAALGYPFAHEYAAYRAEIDKASIAAAATLEAVNRANQGNLEIAKMGAEAQIAKLAKIGPVLPEVISAPLGIDNAVILATLVRDDTSNVVAFAVSDYVPWRPALLALAPQAGTIQWKRQLPGSSSGRQGHRQDGTGEGDREASRGKAERPTGADYYALDHGGLAHA